MRLDFSSQVDQRKLADEVQRILGELVRDARAQGFDVSPYLQRLADAGIPIVKKPRAFERRCH
jgi:hypothetical protein